MQCKTTRSHEFPGLPILFPFSINPLKLVLANRSDAINKNYDTLFNEIFSP